MAEIFRLHVVTPQGQILDRLVREVTAPGLEGEFGVLPRHARFMAALGVGELRYVDDAGEPGVLAVAGGFAEVTPAGVNILAQTAEQADEIDVARAEAALRRAEQRLAAPEDAADFEGASVAIERSLARLRVAQARGIKATRTGITTTAAPSPGEEPRH